MWFMHIWFIFVSGAPQNSVDSVIQNVNKAIRQGRREQRKKLSGIKRSRQAVKDYALTTYGGVKGMTKYDRIAAGAAASGDIASAVQKFATGDTQKIVSGCLDLANAAANFLPPPASIVTGSIVGVANIFLGGKLRMPYFGEFLGNLDIVRQ